MANGFISRTTFLLYIQVSDVIHIHTHVYTFYYNIRRRGTLQSVNIIIAGRCSFSIVVPTTAWNGFFIFFLFSRTEKSYFLFYAFFGLSIVFSRLTSVSYIIIIYITYTFRHYIWPRAISVYDVIKTRDGCVCAPESKSYYYIFFSAAQRGTKLASKINRCCNIIIY